jgi:hypothetical protein
MGDISKGVAHTLYWNERKSQKRQKSPVNCRSIWQGENVSNSTNTDTVEWPDPRPVFPLWVSALSSRRIGDSKSCSPDLEIGTLNKWLASRMLVWLSEGFSTVLPPVPLWYCTWAWFNREVSSAVASGQWVCQAYESANDVQGCKRYTARQTDMIMWSCRGHHCRKTDLTPRVFPF